MDDAPQTLVALELIRRAIADLPVAFVRNLAKSRGEEPAPAKPVNPANPAVVMTPNGPQVDPLKVLAPKGPAPAPGAPEAGKKTHEQLAKLQKQAADDLKAAAKAQKGAGAGGDEEKRGLVRQVGAAVGTVLGKFSSALGAILPPLNLLAGVLGSTTSGFSLVTRTLNLLYAVLAPVLLPVLFLFAAGLLFVSDAVMKYLWPAFKNLW